MPPLENVVWVVEYNQTLNDCANQKAYAGQIYLPADGSKPA
jgi:hypothetical protein